MHMTVHAKDGWVQPAPWKCDTLNVAPGERYDVIVNCNNPGTWAFHCHILPHAGVRPWNAWHGHGVDRAEVTSPAEKGGGDVRRFDSRAVGRRSRGGSRVDWKAVLGTAKDITVVGEARNGREAVDAAVRLNPDVVVMDLSMDEMDGAAATKESAAAKGVKSRVLILTMHAEDEFLIPLLEAGASGYLVKNAADRDLVDAVRIVAGGQQYPCRPRRRARWRKS